jgi:hypothetical protein
MYTQIDLRGLDIDCLVEVVDTARAAVARKFAAGELSEKQANYWRNNAIEHAYDFLLTNDASILVGSDGSAFIPSAGSEPGTFYHANGTCSCRGYTYHGHCWHQAAARLIKRYRERRAEEPQPTSSEVTEKALISQVL